MAKETDRTTAAKSSKTRVVRVNRNVDLQRLILPYIEEYIPPQGGLDRQTESLGNDYPTVCAQAALLVDDGRIDRRVMKGPTGGPV